MGTHTYTIVHAYISKLADKAKVKSVYVFGSASTGTMHDGSDIDILVVGQFPTVPPSQRLSWLNTLAHDIPTPHPLHVFGVSPQAYKRAAPWSILGEAKRTSTLVWSRRPKA